MAFAGDLLRGNTTTHASNSKGTDTFFRRDGSCWCCRSPREPMTKVRRLHLMVLPVSPYFERNSGPERHQLTTEMLKASATYLLLFNAPAPTPTTQRVYHSIAAYASSFFLPAPFKYPPDPNLGYTDACRPEQLNAPAILVGCGSIFGRLYNSHLERALLPCSSTLELIGLTTRRDGSTKASSVWIRPPSS